MRSARRVFLGGIVFATAGAGAGAGAQLFQDDLVTMQRALMEATYRGDLDSLDALASAFAGMGADHADGWLAHYHAGFAHFVLALMRGPNGLDSARGDPARMLEHVNAAVVQLEASLAVRTDVADPLALLAHLYSMQIRGNPRVAPVAGPKARGLLSDALRLEPGNPRVVLIDAMRTFWSPPARGGDRARGLRRWREAIALFEREAVPSAGALPSWGHAEAWAWLPGAYLALDAPDVAAARAAAGRALEIRPDFRWLRVSLLASIEAAHERNR